MASPGSTGDTDLQDGTAPLDKTIFLQVGQPGLLHVASTGKTTSDEVILHQKAEVVGAFGSAAASDVMGAVPLKAAATTFSYCRQQLFGRLIQAFLGSIRGRAIHTLNFLLEPIDVSLKWIHLRLQVQVLRSERLYLRFHLLKLSVQRKHLELLLASKRNALFIKESGNLPHD